MVFQVGLLTDAGAADIGWSLVPLSHLHGDAAARALAVAGVEVRLHAKVTAVEPQETGWSVHVDGEQLAADSLILAVPPPAAEALAPAGALTAPAGWSEQLGSSPILNVHVVLDRRVLDDPFVAGVGTPIQWVFDRTRQSGLHADKQRADQQYLAVSVSAADELIQLPVAELRDRLVPDIYALLRPSAMPRSSISSSRESATRPSGRRRAAEPCASQPSRQHRGCSWRARGPIPAGRRPWKARYAAETPPPTPWCTGPFDRG